MCMSMRSAAGLFQDVRFGLRLFGRSPVFTIVAGLQLAIDISANTILFSVVEALQLRPLPVPHPEQLVRLVEQHPHDFLTWDFPYPVCEGARLVREFSEVICQGTADV